MKKTIIPRGRAIPWYDRSRCLALVRLTYLWTCHTMEKDEILNYIEWISDNFHCIITTGKTVSRNTTGVILNLPWDCDVIEKLRRLYNTPGQSNDIYGPWIGEGFESYTPYFCINPSLCNNHYFDWNWNELRYQRGRVDMDIMWNYIEAACRERWSDWDSL